MNSTPLRHRVAEFHRRLASIPAAATAAEAYQQLCDMLNAVEDDLSGLVYDSALPRGSGRMYPPQPDSERPDLLGRAAVRRYRSQGHNTLIGDNGAIEIQRLDDHVEFTKPGCDGRSIGEL